MKIYLYKKTFCTAVFLLLFICTFAFAAEDSPEEVVKKYYTADLNGGKLAGDAVGADVIRSITAWENEAGWDMFYITKKVYITNIEKVKENEVHVKVHYENVVDTNVEAVVKDSPTEDIDFVLGKGCIDDSIFYPNETLTLKLYDGKIIKRENPQNKDYPFYMFFDETITNENQLKERLNPLGINAEEVKMVLTVWRKAMKEKNQWKIKRPIFQSHASPKAIITNYKELLKDTPKEDKTRIEELTKIIEELEKIN